MWFFPQIGLNKDRSLFIKIIIASGLIHACMVVCLFVGHLFFSEQSLVLGKTGAARVSIAGGIRKLQGLPVAAAIPTPASNQAKSEPAKAEPAQHVQPTPSPRLPEPEVSESLKKNAKIPDLPDKKVDARKTTPQPSKKEKPASAKDKPSEVPPFSELKKKYTSLKKKEKQIAAKETEPQPAQKEIVKQLPDAKEEVIHEQKNVQPQKQATGIEGGFSQAGAYSTERLEFATQEAAESDSVIVQEIERHYRRPPGFDDHESFVFTFEIQNGKATAIGSKGPEPLVIYSAVKEAVLKATFAVSQRSKKILLTIK